MSKERPSSSKQIFVTISENDQNQELEENEEVQDELR